MGCVNRPVKKSTTKSMNPEFFHEFENKIKEREIT